MDQQTTLELIVALVNLAAALTALIAAVAGPLIRRERERRSNRPATGEERRSQLTVIRYEHYQRARGRAGEDNNPRGAKRTRE